ncbi:MAG: carbohydrate ABC transporter permease [Eubacteriales bacterium]|nr:carbohydrate ABC transporter permease [Eubacteriales bacterium]
MRKKKGTRNELSRKQKMIAGVLVLAVVLVMALPMWNVIVVATSDKLSASQSGVKLWWDSFSLEGFSYVFTVTKLLRPFLNSLFVTTIATVIQVVLSAFAGYVLIQKDLPFRAAITSFVMLTMMIPGDLTLISVYQLNKQLHLLNSYTGLIANGLISGFSILLMRNYFGTVPYSMAEAARLDGAGEIRIFAKIFLPVSLPGLATVFFMEYVGKWNSIMLPATLVTDQNKYTLPLMLKAMIQSDSSTSGTSIAPENAVMAAIVISTLPLLLIYIFAQKYLLEGMNLGAEKG